MKATLLVLILLGSLNVSAEPVGRAFDSQNRMDLCNYDEICLELNARLANLFVDRVKLTKSAKAAKNSTTNLAKKLKSIEVAVAQCSSDVDYMLETPVRGVRSPVNAANVEACKRRVIAQTLKSKLDNQVALESAILSQGAVESRLAFVQAEIQSLSAQKRERIRQLQRE